MYYALLPMFRTIFPNPHPIIGMISLLPSPGYPAFTRIDAIIARALADLEALERGGATGVLVENDFDQPHTLTVGPEVVAGMTRVVAEVVRRATVPVGVQVLLNDWRASLAIASATGSHFARLDFFVDRARIKAGEIEPEPAAVLAYRQAIGAQHVALLTDIQVKYSTPLEPGKSLATSAHQAVTNGADAIIVTGAATGEMPLLDDLRTAREALGDFPLLVGSGTTSENVTALLRYADGAIVGTALRSGSGPDDSVVEEQVRQLVREATNSALQSSARAFSSPC